MPYNTPPMSALGIQSQQSPYLVHFPRMWYSLYTEAKTNDKHQNEKCSYSNGMNLNEKNTTQLIQQQFLLTSFYHLTKYVVLYILFLYTRLSTIKYIESSAIFCQHCLQMHAMIKVVFHLLPNVCWIDSSHHETKQGQHFR